MAEQLTQKQEGWVSLYDAYNKRLVAIRALLEQGPYSAPATQTNQQLRLELLNTEFALRKHFEAGQKDPALLDLAQARLSQLPAIRQEIIGTHKYDNIGTTPFLAPDVPEGARAQWELDLVQRAKDVATQIADTYNTDVAPYVIETVRQLGAFFIDRSKYIPAPSKLPGLPKTGHAPTDELGGGLLDETIKKATGYRSPGDIIMDEVLGPRSGAPKRQDPLKLMYNNIFNDETIAEAANTLAQLEAAYGGEISYSAETGVFTIAKQSGDFVYRAEISIQDNGTALVTAPAQIAGRWVEATYQFDPASRSMAPLAVTAVDGYPVSAAEEARAMGDLYAVQLATEVLDPRADSGSIDRAAAAALLDKIYEASATRLPDGGYMVLVSTDSQLVGANSEFRLLRDAMLDPAATITKTADGNIIVTAQGRSNLLTPDGIILKVNPADGNGSVSIDILTGARAGLTINADSAATLTPDQLAALSTAISSGSSAGLMGGSFQGLTEPLKLRVQRTATGDDYGNFTVAPVVGDSGEHIGTTLITQYRENDSAVRIETTTYTDIQRPRETVVVSNNQNGQEIRALYLNGRLQGLTQINGAAISSGLNELFVSALKARGIENPSPEEMARVNQSLGDTASARDVVLHEALAELQGKAIAGTDYYGRPTYISKTEANLQSVSNGVGSLIDALSLIKAIQTGQPLPIVASGLRLAADLDYLDGTRDLPELGAAASIAGSVLSLYGLSNALKQGDGIGAITSAAYAVKGAADAANFLQTSGLISEVPAGLQAAGQVLGKALPYINLVNSIAHGDMTGTAVAVVDLVMIEAGVYAIPYIGWAYAIYSIIDSLFSDSDDIPDPWGSGQFVWNGTGISYQSAGETGGNEAVANVMTGVLATLNALIERERQQNPGSALGIIPNRMPSLGYDMSGYRYTDIDPLTGAEKHPALRFDTSGRPYNAEAGSPESYQSLMEGILRSALGRGALAPMWEVQTAKLQTDAGDPRAGLTEEERAGRDGQLAPPGAGEGSQVFRPVALDLDGDGIETMDKAHGVAFDVDDSGYLKQTGWLHSDDAFLTLDRNYNGRTDTGRELFSNATVALGRRGLAGLNWIDADYNGKLTSADPVWNELKVWRDANADGDQDAGESQSLDALGITELDYAMGTYTQNGQKKQLASPDLEADKAGTRINVTPEGILVQASETGHLSLLVTRIDDRTQVEANRDGITGYEDVEIIASSADLLANDTLGGFLGRDLTITGLANFRHGTGFIDVNGFVHFTPEANYAGSGAGFDYVARAGNGQEGTSTVDIALQNVNDAPTLDHVDHTTRAVYGYTPVVYSATDVWGGGQYVSGGEPIYQPYATVWSWNPDSGGFQSSISYNLSQGNGFFGSAEYHTTPIAYEDTGAGRVTGADVDDPASSLTYEVANQPQYGSVSVNADGSFQYTSWKEPGVPSDHVVVNGQYGGIKDGTLYTQSNLPGSAVYPTTDVFKVKITDPHGGSTTQSISVPHFGPYLPPTPQGGGGGKKPIAVDLNSNGFEFVNVNDSNVFFDVNGDGWKRRTSWVGKDDGLLAYDIDGDGRIDKAGEISFARYKEGAQSDLEGLKAFDTNKDGRFSAADDKWAKFGIWQDANQNGLTDPGEFRTLGEMGVTAVGLASDGHFEVINGQTVHGVGAMEMADGSELAIADVTFAYSNETQVPQPGGGSAVVSTSPFSPSGEAIEGTPDKDLILGKNGNNIVNGYAGDDVIFEDGGNDIIDAGDGNDLVYAGADNDLVMGGSGDDAVYAGLGDDLVFGGDGHDAILGEGGNDVAFGGAGNDLISGGWGNDVLSGDGGDDQVYGESGNDALFGRDGDDELAGMDGADRLDGGAGNDLLDGGAGADEMIGGAGDDAYAVDDAGDTVTELAGDGSDTVRAAIGYALGEHLENLVLTGSANLSGTGNELDNVLTGNRGNNTLAGGAGNDVLDGGSGADTLIGGAGDDTYIVDNGGDGVTEAAGEGVDTVKASVSHSLSANVENLVLTGMASIIATGNELDNRLTGNAGNNLLDGGAGADTMAGGRGNDTYVVDQIGDAVVEQAGEGVDTVVSGIDYALGANVEDLVLTGTAHLTGTGNELANVLAGNAGNNLLDGGAGADTMAGGAGSDTYIVDNTGDVVIENPDEGIDAVQSGVSYTLSANAENLALTGAADIDATGNDLGNVLMGNAGNNILDGGIGADSMIGGAGNDTYVVDNLGDTVTEAADAGNDTVLSSVSFVLPEHVENLALTGGAVIDGTGNGLDNVMAGNGAANVLDGGSGADAMAGGAGDDVYYVDNAGDAMTEADEGGYDTVRTAISLASPDNVERIELLGGANLDATGNGLDNALIGNSGANHLDGGAGADAMAGGAGDDAYIVDNIGDTVAEGGNEGNDSIFSSVSYVLPANVEHLTLTGSANIDGTGNELANTLVGNSGNNVLDGGAGADAMAGGAGDDAYWVDDAADTVWEAAGEGIDSIYTRVSYVLPENVENLYLVGDGNIGAGGNGADNLLVGNGGDNAISGGGGNDTLDGQAGNDTLDGGDGNDILIGGAGNDVLFGGNGSDRLDGGIGDDAYLINAGDGLDRIDDAAGTDAVRFGAGLSLDNVALRVTQANGVYTAHVRVLNAGGCEQADQGFDFAVMLDAAGNYVSPIEQFRFADGSVKTLDDLLIKTRHTYGTAKDQTIATGRDDDIIHAGPMNNTVRAGTGNDIVYAGPGGDAVFGEGGNDYLQGGTGDDMLDGGCGTDILAGSNGRDLLRDMGGNNAFLGGFQDDRIEAGNGNDFIAGGKHDDTILTGGGANVVAFNRQDGRDTILPGIGAANALSLGSGITAGDLAFSRSAQDLVLDAGHDDRITFKDWYGGEANRSFVTLQIVDDDAADRTEAFDFQMLASQFDAAHAANPNLSAWSLMNGLLDAHLSGSDNGALGGEVAVRYAEEGALSMSPGAVQEVLRDTRFGTQAQTVGNRLDAGVQQFRIG